MRYSFIQSSHLKNPSPDAAVETNPPLHPTETASKTHLLQNIRFLLLIARRQTHLLLPLIEHHLLNHLPRLPIQITQIAVLGLNLGDVDFWRRGYDVRPPFHFVDFVEVDAELLACGRGFERPGRFVRVDGVREVALYSHLLS